MAKLNVSDHGTEVPLQEMELLALTLLPAIQSFFESEEGEKVLGKDTAAHLAAAAKEAKAKGVKYCICPACTAGGWLLDHESEF